MKSKDQILLEQAYLKVNEAHPHANPETRWKPSREPSLASIKAQEREFRNQERNAGLENDEELSREPYTSYVSQTPKVEIDPSKFQDKKIDYRMNQYDGFEIVIDGKKVGDDDLSSSNAKYIVDLLKDVEKNKDNSVLQGWYKTAIKDL
jgi:hypothetical protein